MSARSDIIASPPNIDIINHHNNVRQARSAIAKESNVHRATFDMTTVDADDFEVPDWEPEELPEGLEEVPDPVLELLELLLLDTVVWPAMSDA
jgi:hypothetical protein